MEFTEECAGAFEKEVDDRYCIENYLELLRLDSGALAVLSDGMTWENWTKWENAAILVAITEGLIKPDMDVVSRYPSLNRWVVPTYDEEVYDDHDEERKQIIKTGGASLGGATIYARGWRYGKNGGWSRRALESFDATARIRPTNPDDYVDGYDDTFSEAGPSLYNRSNDAESYDPR